MAERIRVVIADDSPTIRHYLKTLLKDMADMEIVGVAQNGEEALAVVSELRPDVITMDINMPKVDGLEATRQIMRECPTPIVVVSGMLEADIQLSLQALEAGALAVIGKPPSRDNPAFPQVFQRLITTLRAMARVSVVARRERFQSETVTFDDTITPLPIKRRPSREIDVIAIGASTGGPSALYRIMSQLPPTMRIPIVIVQHLPDEFIVGMVRWLQRATHLDVVIAEDGMYVTQGMVILARGNQHMALVKERGRLMIRLIQTQGDYRHQPAVDVLFESVANTCQHRALGIILTGMGDDGASGLKSLRDCGAITIAQDEPSSTVFGMPSAAIEQGGVEIVASLTQIPHKIMKLV